MAGRGESWPHAGYDVIDLNFACPVKKIKNKARGGHMLLDVRPRHFHSQSRARCPARRTCPPPSAFAAGSMIRPNRPSGFTRSSNPLGTTAIPPFACMAEPSSRNICGRASWPFLREVKQRYPNRTILGSGDVFTAEDAVRMLRETGVDIVWIARGAIGNPWIFDSACRCEDSGWAQDSEKNTI